MNDSEHLGLIIGRWCMPKHRREFNPPELVLCPRAILRELIHLHDVLDANFLQTEGGTFLVSIDLHEEPSSRLVVQVDELVSLR